MGKNFIVGVSGGSGSGKTFFIHRLLDVLPANQVCLISQDNYYRNIKEVPVDSNGIENFDTLEAVDFVSFARDLELLKNGHEVNLVEYTFNNRNKAPRSITLTPAPVVIVEGIFVFSNPQLFNELDLKIFIDASDKVRIRRRIERDRQERGYDVDDVMYRYQNHVTPTYLKYIDPFKSQADLVINNSGNIDKAIEMVGLFLRKQLDSTDNH